MIATNNSAANRRRGALHSEARNRSACQTTRKPAIASNACHACNWISLAWSNQDGIWMASTIHGIPKIAASVANGSHSAGRFRTCVAAQAAISRIRK
jgi:hypothetical protein